MTETPSEVLRTLRLLNRRRELLLREVEAACALIGGSELGTYDNFLARCATLEATREQFRAVQLEIFAANLDAIQEKDKLSELAEETKFDDCYFRAKGMEASLRRRNAAPLIDLSVAANTSTRVEESTFVRLPRIAVPTWDGNIKTFANFFQLYNSIIHLSNHADVVKLSYLRSLLTGPPLTLIDHLPITDENYDIAYTLLKTRYDCKRSRATHHINNMFNFTALSGESLAELRSFLNVFHTEMNALKNLDLADLHDFIMVCCALRCLPNSLRLLFERQLTTPTEIPTFESLISFVEAQCRIKENMEQLNNPSSSSGKVTLKTTNSAPVRKSSQYSLIVTPSVSIEEKHQIPNAPGQVPVCPVCGNSHTIYSCEVYNNLPIDGRKDTINRLKRCVRCLGNHAADKCLSTRRCKYCRRTTHHYTIHYTRKSSEGSQTSTKGIERGGEIQGNSKETESSQPTVGVPAILSGQSHHTLLTSSEEIVLPEQSVLLGTVQALMQNKYGRWEPIRLVIDVGSQLNLISMECVQRLGLTAVPRQTSVCGAMNQNVGISQGVVSCRLATGALDGEAMTLYASVVDRVCSDLPTTPISQEVVQRFCELNLADKEFFKPAKIDFLLGAAMYSSLFKPGYEIIQGEPSAIQTIFGFVLIGSTPALPQGHTNESVAMITLEDSVQRFWQDQEVHSVIPMDPADALVEEHFRVTHSRDESGKYIVRLPFKDSKLLPPFGNSREAALKRWTNLERKLRSDENLRVSYHSFLQEYLDLGHMALAQETGVYFIPHFAIIRDSLTNSVRVVFDGSCKDSSGLSLNDRMFTGPALQKDISEIILMFRLFPIALTVDVRMMYRQILLHTDDQKYQHIFWRKSEAEPLLEYSLKTVTYGLNPSPFHALRVLQQLVTDEGQDLPLASTAIQESTYMDDVCCSVQTESEAVQLKVELIELMRRGGMELRKWSSNIPDILRDIPIEHRVSVLRLQTDNKSTLHVLGIQWTPSKDCFSYRVREPPSTGVTKRSVLSHIASIFDPMGWLAPLVFWAKSFLRTLWTENLVWDTPLPQDLLSQWLQFSQQLQCLDQVVIPRLCTAPSSASFDLVGFCDGSELGYGAAVYVRSCAEDGSGVQVRLVKAKTRVAPLKPLTIPRLELNGAVLLAQLVGSVKPLLAKLNITNIHLFTDSTTVLSWLDTPPAKLKTYCANRVVEILNYTRVSQWNHVASEQNAADCASRGLYPSMLVEHPLWWSGPSFLRDPVGEWPSAIPLCPTTQTISELRSVDTPIAISQLTTRKKTKAPRESLIEVINKFSSLGRLRRVLGWVLRFVHNVRVPKCKRVSGPLRVQELDSSLNLCLKTTQEHYFLTDLQAISKGRLPSKPLQTLLPYIGEDGLLRVGGRLQHSRLPARAKHPPILPKNSNLASLICDFYHVYLLHAGPQATQARIQSNFWIMSLRPLLRQRIWQCLTCHKSRAKLQHPVMGELPAERVSPSRPFAYTGVDMAGPIYLKESTRRNASLKKAYFAIFVCMSTKAAHLEVVSDLTTAAFQAALDRFIARRGLCSRIYCDNGGNFVGAAQEAKSVKKFLLDSEPDIIDFLSTHDIDYQFNPPEAPWMGGLWESAVKSAKRHLSKITHHRNLTFEEMATLLSRVEATLNSGPLTRDAADPTEPLDVLTPGHFLIGGPLRAPAEHDFTAVPENRLSRWQVVQRAHQEFWRRWSGEYLQTLMSRSKWTSPAPPIHQGDVVFICKQNTKPLNWPLGIVEELTVGKDHVARSAKVRTNSGLLVRPIAKLLPLPPSDRSSLLDDSMAH